MTASGKRILVALLVMAAATGVPTLTRSQPLAPGNTPAPAEKPATSASPTVYAAPRPLTEAEKAAASDNAEYHAQLEAAAASLKADIQAQSNASAEAVTEDQTGPSKTGVIAAAVIAVLGIGAMIFIIPATLRARRRRNDAISDLIAGGHETKRRRSKR